MKFNFSHSLLSLSQTNQSLFYLKILLFKSLKPQTVFSQSTTKNEMKIVTPHYVCSWIKLTNPFQKTPAGIYSISFLFYLLEKKATELQKKTYFFNNFFLVFTEIHKQLEVLKLKILKYLKPYTISLILK